MSPAGEKKAARLVDREMDLNPNSTANPYQVAKEEKKNSLRINIELDIDVEIHLTARIKGDITIGLL